MKREERGEMIIKESSQASGGTVDAELTRSSCTGQFMSKIRKGGSLADVDYKFGICKKERVLKGNFFN
jgi:hypothetical protein